MVSVIIPCYNSESSIEETVESALGQTHPECEVIVVDDGSTDGSRRIIEGFGSLVRAFFGPNRGACHARNRGLAEARGEWIQFLDADDVLLPACVEKKLAMKVADDEIPCCSIDVTPGGCREDLSDFWFREDYPVDYVVRAGGPSTPQPLHRREDLERIGGFREELPCAQDFDLDIRLMLELGKRFRVSPEVGVLVRPVPGSLSRRSGVRMHFAFHNIRMLAFKLLAREAPDDEAVLRPFADMLMEVARVEYGAGHREDARWLFSVARRVNEEWWTKGYGGSWWRQALARFLGPVGYEKINDTWRSMSGIFAARSR